MVNAVAFFTAVAILCRASANIVTTSLLLPSGLFNPVPSFPLSAFLGQVTVTKSTTYYILDCSAGGAALYFYPGSEGCSGSSYTFSESSASTRYSLDNAETVTGTDAAPSTTEEVLEQYLQIPLDTSGSATCITTNSSDENTSYATNIESSLYSVIFTTASGYGAASSTTATSATPSPTSSAPTAKSTSTSSPKSSSSTTAHPPLGPSSKVGVGLGVPLGACALAGVALLLYRHGKHKERSRLNQMGNLAPPGGFVSESEGKRMSEAAVASQALGRQPPVYSMEMQG
ncbi:MAG: hypothetical protein ALECFALPRED_006181 [Alectoria fallacina]|uniref:Mid2 domain-containing protein n=1 Tax=Alectoria fallacina TaxID=1903189 RepID=A0A8H3G1K4_9LECA|nr:MAG: hypothetical protein ALECFALPRED_006181 [Alectoria fallacina]